jgi:3-isopropylmalate dehydrogenase
MTKKIAVLAGDGIGPEIVDEAIKVLQALVKDGLDIEFEYGLIGGAAYDETGTPLPDETVEISKSADAILLGAVGGYKWESLDISVRPEKGLLGIRSELNLFANLRPAVVFDGLIDASSLKPELVRGLDILILRELTGGIYFGEPRGVEELGDGERRGVNTEVYTTSEVERVGRVAFELAEKRKGFVHSVEKANVMERPRASP